MTWTLVKLMFLCLMVETLMKDGKQHFAHSKTIVPQSTLYRSYMNLHEQNLTLNDTNETTDGVTNLRANAIAKPEGLAQLLRKIETCREKYPTMDNKAFYLTLYMSLRERGKGDSIIACNVTKDEVVKIQMPLLDILKMAANDETFLNRPRSQSRPTAHEKGLRWNSEPSNNLELKLGHNWMENNPSIPHLSHIYIGHSLYPIITEESRIIDKNHTFPPPSITERSMRAKNRRRS